MNIKQLFNMGKQKQKEVPVETIAAPKPPTAAEVKAKADEAARQERTGKVKSYKLRLFTGQDRIKPLLPILEDSIHLYRNKTINRTHSALVIFDIQSKTRPEILLPLLENLLCQDTPVEMELLRSNERFEVDINEKVLALKARQKQYSEGIVNY